jgi:predicted transcriptional regulator of viral defense system
MCPQVPGSDIAEACKRVPHGVVCLVSALAMHDLSTQVPHEVWIAIDRKARKPAADYPPLRVVRFSGKAPASHVHEQNRSAACARADHGVASVGIQ